MLPSLQKDCETTVQEQLHGPDGGRVLFFFVSYRCQYICMQVHTHGQAHAHANTCYSTNFRHIVLSLLEYSTASGPTAV